VEQLLADLGASSGLKWIALRYFDAAGADPDGEIGEEHNPETHLIPLALQAADRGASFIFLEMTMIPPMAPVREIMFMSSI
jgi:UDP-glucose 4-epimerase